MAPLRFCARGRRTGTAGRRRGRAASCLQTVPQKSRQRGEPSALCQRPAPAAAPRPRALPPGPIGAGTGPAAPALGPPPARPRYLGAGGTRGPAARPARPRARSRTRSRRGGRRRRRGRRAAARPWLPGHAGPGAESSTAQRQRSLPGRCAPARSARHGPARPICPAPPPAPHAPGPVRPRLSRALRRHREEFPVRKTGSVGRSVCGW